MHELLSVAEMAEADRLTIAGGRPGIDLMESAGHAVADGAAALSPLGAPVLVVAGPGNNGGDGLVAARLLASAGRPVSVVMLGPAERLAGDAAIALARWGRPIHPATPDGALPEAAVVIDALFGAGLSRAPEGTAAALIATMNRARRVLAVDLPSGISGDTGAALGAAVQAEATVTFFRRKPGHLLYPGRAACGAVTVADIGIPAAVLAAIGPRTVENGPALWGEAFTPPAATDHKYRRGHALVVSGGPARTGAARLTAGAALRAGAGLVTLATPSSALAVNAAHLTAVMLARADDAAALAALIAGPRLSAVAIGPALGRDAEARTLVEVALAGAPALVLDADALTLWDSPDSLFGAIAPRVTPTILTPHEGEFARLFPDLADRPRPERAQAAAERSGAIMVLKGADTIIAAPDGRLAINANAPPWLATAGSGDVLAGIACGLLAQHVPGFEAAAAAVWLHGAAGAEAGPGLTAEDLSPALRPVLRRLWRA